MTAEEPIQIHVSADIARYAKPFKALLPDRTPAQGMAVGGFVFAHPPADSPRILLVQREKRDGRLAGKWEVPGGGCEDSDPTVLHSLAREVFEEAGLHMTGVVRKVGADQHFKTRSGLQVVKLSFEITIKEIEGSVHIDEVPVELSSEHQGFAWATRAEVEEDKYPMTHPEQRAYILQSFAPRMEEQRR